MNGMNNQSSWWATLIDPTMKPTDRNPSRQRLTILKCAGSMPLGEEVNALLKKYPKGTVVAELTRMNENFRDKRQPVFAK